MCDFSIVSGLLVTAAATITAISIIIVAAIATNSNFFTAGGSVALMVTAAVLSGTAAATLSAAAAAAHDFFSCVLTTYPSAVACSARFDRFFYLLIGIAGTLTAQIVACALTAGLAAVPWLGTIPMAAILGTLTIQSVALGTLSSFYAELRSCINEAASMELLPGWLTVVLIITTVIVSLATSYALFKGIPKIISSPYTHR